MSSQTETINARIPTSHRSADAPTGISVASSVATQIGSLVIGKTRYDVFFKNQPVRLTPIEYNLLRCLAETPGVALSYQQIVQRTHQFETDQADAQRLIKQHIFNIRRKIDPCYLVNDRGLGYMLVNPETHCQNGC
jgi:DNA-binding response OmpR family regulator